MISVAQYANSAPVNKYKTITNHCALRQRTTLRSGSEHSHQESQAMEQCVNYGSHAAHCDARNGVDDDRDGWHEHARDTVKHEVPEPKPRRIRDAIRVLHRLYERAPLARHVERKECGIYRLCKTSGMFVHPTSTNHACSKDSKPWQDRQVSASGGFEVDTIRLNGERRCGTSRCVQRAAEQKATQGVERS